MLLPLWLLLLNFRSLVCLFSQRIFSAAVLFSMPKDNGNSNGTVLDSTLVMNKLHRGLLWELKTKCPKPCNFFGHPQGEDLTRCPHVLQR